jgi:hypothetical protein
MRAQIIGSNVAPVAALNMKAVDLAFTIRSVPHHSKYPRLIDDVTVVLAGIGAIISEKVALLEIPGQISLTFTAKLRFVDLNSFKWTVHQLLIRNRLSSQIELPHALLSTIIAPVNQHVLAQ